MLSTPPAFILSQDQTLVLKFVLVKDKHPAYLFPFLPMSRFCSKNSLKRIFRVGIYCSVIKVLLPLRSNFDILSWLDLFVNYFFKLFSKFFRKDFQYSTFRLFRQAFFFFIKNSTFAGKRTEKEGFEPSRRLPDLHP